MKEEIRKILQELKDRADYIKEESAFHPAAGNLEFRLWAAEQRIAYLGCALEDLMGVLCKEEATPREADAKP